MRYDGEAPPPKAMTMEPTTEQELRAARRPKPPSLKQQAMEQLPMVHYSAIAEAIVMKALESLPDD